MKRSSLYEDRDVDEATQLWTAMIHSKGQCRRCGGLMVGEGSVYRWVEFLEKCGPHTCVAWRCVLCGNVIDPVILLNRARRGGSTRVKDKQKADER